MKHEALVTELEKLGLNAAALRALGGAGAGMLAGYFGGNPALGAAIGGGIGAVGHFVAPDKMRWAENFANRQIHAITGQVPGGHQQGTHGYRQALEDMGHAVAPDVADQGYTHLPGVLHGLVNRPMDTVKGTARAFWGVGGGANVNLNRLAAVGFPAYGLYQAFKDPETADGPGRGEQIASNLANAAAGIGTIGLPMSVGMGIGTVADKAGRFVGRGIDRLRGHAHNEDRDQQYADSPAPIGYLRPDGY